MPKEIPPSSFECDCGHLLEFSEGTVLEMEAMSHKKKMRLSDHTDHTVVFHKGKMVDVICHNEKVETDQIRTFRDLCYCDEEVVLRWIGG